MPDILQQLHIFLYCGIITITITSNILAYFYIQLFPTIVALLAILSDLY